MRTLLARALGAAGLELSRAMSGLRRGWQRRPALRRLTALAFAAVLAVAGVSGLAFALTLPSLLPSDLDWRATAVLLERDARPGDALIVAPAWAERLRMVAPPGLRVVSTSQAGGAESAGELEGVRRVWVLSLTGAPGFSWQSERDLLVRSAAPDPPLRLGRITVTRYELAHPDLPLANLGDRLAGATVALGGQPCAEEHQRFRCTGARSTAEVERAVVEVNGLPRPCLLVKLTGEAAPVRISFRSVPVGHSLRGNAGLAARDDEPVGSLPLTVAVRVEGEESGAVQLEGAGWPTYRVDTSRWAGERHAVSLEVVAPGDRAICLQAVTLP